MSDEQLRFDRAAIVRELPRLVAAQGSRTQSGPQRSPLRILVELAGEVWWVHHGQARGFSKFVRSLAKEAGIQCTSAMVRSTIKEVREDLSRRAELPPVEAADHQSFVGPARAGKRGDILDTHFIGYDDDGWEIIGGYEPARDPDLDPAKKFASYLKKRSP